jgi:hypothetical protein
MKKFLSMAAVGLDTYSETKAAIFEADEASGAKCLTESYSRMG